MCTLHLTLYFIEVLALFENVVAYNSRLVTYILHEATLD